MKKSLEIEKMRALLQGLFEVRPLIYWTDLLVNTALGYGCLYLSFTELIGGFWACILILISSITLYRAALFIHEIAHLRLKLPGFTILWNLLVGIPLAMPSFIYYQSHLLHHKEQTYGTEKDGEYIPFAALPPIAILKYLGLSFVGPLLMIGRFAFLTIPSFFIQSLRSWIVGHASSLVIETDFVGSEPVGRDRSDWRWQEPLAAFYWLTLIILLGVGSIPLDKALWFLLLMCSVHVVNALRTLVAHRWQNGALTPTDIEGQYLDSINLVGGGFTGFLNSLLAPVGLRFHALHHLFQGMPYHAFGEAHKRFSNSLGAESFYFKANETSFLKPLSSLLRSSFTRT